MLVVPFIIIKIFKNAKYQGTFYKKENLFSIMASHLLIFFMIFNLFIL